MNKELTETSAVLSENGQSPPSHVSALLSRYVVYMPEDGVDLEAFVEHGGRLVGREKLIFSRADWSSLDAKIEKLRMEMPRFAAQLEFLTDFAADVTTDSPRAARNEAIFALLYCAKDMDLIPDELPVIGYSDDAAVTSLALSRNNSLFEGYCDDHAIDWSTLRPDSSG